jgi:zinc transporter, ZIP family
MALGAGLLIGSVAFELIDEALATTEVALVGRVTLVAIGFAISLMLSAI